MIDTRKMFFILLCFAGMLLTPAQSSAKPIELMHPADIADIEKLDREVSQLFAKVKQCAAAGLAPVTECFCYYPGKLASARDTYESVLAKHPDWEDRSVRWRDEPYIANFHMAGLRPHMEHSCGS